MCKYEMDPASIVDETERQDWVYIRMDRRTEGRTKWNQYTTLNFVAGGYDNMH